MASFAILDDLQENSTTNQIKYEEMNINAERVNSSLFELTEPFEGSTETIHAYVFKNYFPNPYSPINLLIIINEDKGDAEKNGFRLSRVNAAVFPLYCLADDDAVQPFEGEELPKFSPEDEQKIKAWRALPKKEYSAPFDPAKDKWSVNKISAELQLSNRLVGRYCKILGI